MKRLILLLGFAIGITHARSSTQEERFVIEYEENPSDPNKKPIVLSFNQQCSVDNKQQVEQSCPQSPNCTGKCGSSDQNTPQPTTSWFSFENLYHPAKISIAGILFVLVYYMKTKMALYSIGQTCIEQAFWSLWQMKKQSILLNEQDLDMHLLYDILHVYGTDQYATAMAQFLQDIDKEKELLDQYLQTTSKAGSTVFYFLLPDMKQDIVEAQNRLVRLAYLKQKVLYWLAQGEVNKIKVALNGDV